MRVQVHFLSGLHSNGQEEGLERGHGSDLSPADVQLLSPARRGFRERAALVLEDAKSKAGEPWATGVGRALANHRRKLEARVTWPSVSVEGGAGRGGGGWREARKDDDTEPHSHLYHAVREFPLRHAPLPLVSPRTRISTKKSPPFRLVGWPDQHTSMKFGLKRDRRPRSIAIAPRGSRTPALLERFLRTADEDGLHMLSRRRSSERDRDCSEARIGHSKCSRGSHGEPSGTPVFPNRST